MAAPPKSFAVFIAQVRALFASKLEARRLTLLTPSRARLVADTAEKTPAFRALAADLTESASASYLSSELLRRSRFYHGVEERRSEEELWTLIEPYTKSRTAIEKTLLMLDGCMFPRERFDFMAYRIVKFSESDLHELQPAQDFYPYEHLDRSFTEHWVIEKVSHYETGPTRLRIPWLDRPVLFQHWEPLFGLGLYKNDCFYVPRILVVEPGYQVLRYRDESPRVELQGGRDGEPEEVPAEYFTVTEEGWTDFEKYLRFFEGAMAYASTWRSIRVAARRYLRASFMSDPNGKSYDDDDREDVLLQYVFGLESLLLASDREAIADKIATRVAILVGDSDEERARVFKSVKDSYDARSRLAHGRETEARLDVRTLRGIFRTVALVILNWSGRLNSEDNLGKNLQALATSDALRSEVAQARQAVLEVVELPRLDC